VIDENHALRVQIAHGSAAVDVDAVERATKMAKPLAKFPSDFRPSWAHRSFGHARTWSPSTLRNPEGRRLTAEISSSSSECAPLRSQSGHKPYFVMWVQVTSPEARMVREPRPARTLWMVPGGEVEPPRY